jgi:hypothetical protein
VQAESPSTAQREREGPAAKRWEGEGLVVADRKSPQRHVWRARIVLLSADRHGTTELMRLTGKAKTCVWRWQERFMVAGADSLLRAQGRRSIAEDAWHNRLLWSA